MKTDIIYRTRKDGLLAKVTDDVEDILENNARLRATPQKSDWGREIADVPNVVLIQWMNEENDRGNPVRLFTKEFMLMVRRRLQDPDNAKFRTDGYNFRTGWNGNT